MPEAAIHSDVVIIGGGIAGLWTLARLRGAGYSCVLVEANALGAGQTIASQGIIHGGVKYTLGGAASKAAKLIAAMPETWGACLKGQGEVDLRGARVLSEHQYLWTTAGLRSRFMAAAASRVIRTEVEHLDREKWPEGFPADQAAKGVQVYRVPEPVLDPASVVQALSAPHAGACLRARDREGVRIMMDADHPLGVIVTLAGDLGMRELRTRHLILAAGAGNEGLLRQFTSEASPANDVGGERPLTRRTAMQRRPLHMVMARGEGLPKLFGHCLGATDKPRLTITSQEDAAGRTVWSIGGQIAESGVALDRDEQVRAARSEVEACLPWVGLAGVQWSSYLIDRAEGITPDGARPDAPVLRSEGGVLVVWPTKLAFAPLVAAGAVDWLRAERVKPERPQPVIEREERPARAPLPWNAEGVPWR